MDCNVILDLLPLYVDGCCSGESGALVQEHVGRCDGCRKALEQMRAGIMVEEAPAVPAKLSRVNDWKASVLQSVLLFASFGLITLGVTMENAIKSGSNNGLWAFLLIVPAVGLLLSLANWYFVRQYKTGKQFVLFSAAAFLAVTACGYIWAALHYGVVSFLGLGLAVTAACGVGAVLAARSFTRLLGKE